MTTRLSNTVTLVRAVHAFPPTHCGVWRQVRVGWEKNSSSHRGMLKNKKNKQKKSIEKCTHEILFILNVWKENWKKLTLTAINKASGK